MHNCPECEQACYCGGDIDDIDTGDEEAKDNCSHCLGCSGLFDDEEDRAEEFNDQDFDEDFDEQESGQKGEAG